MLTTLLYLWLLSGLVIVWQPQDLHTTRVWYLMDITDTPGRRVIPLLAPALGAGLLGRATYQTPGMLYLDNTQPVRPTRSASDEASPSTIPPGRMAGTRPGIPSGRGGGLKIRQCVDSRSTRGTMRCVRIDIADRAPVAAADNGYNTRRTPCPDNAPHGAIPVHDSESCPEPVFIGTQCPDPGVGTGRDTERAGPVETQRTRGILQMIPACVGNSTVEDPRNAGSTPARHTECRDGLGRVTTTSNVRTAGKTAPFQREDHTMAKRRRKNPTDAWTYDPVEKRWDNSDPGIPFVTSGHIDVAVSGVRPDGWLNDETWDMVVSEFTEQ